MNKGNGLASIGVAALWCATAPHAYGGGFLLQEQSTREIGRAFSGAAASADDPSTIYYNPAGMTELEGLQLSFGGTAMFIQSGQSDRGTTITRPGGGPQPVGGSDGGNPFKSVTPLPTSYASWQVGDSGLWLGFGLNSPYGLQLRYDRDFFARYESVHSKLMTLNAQPSIAYKVSDAISIGAGLDVQYADATLTRALPSLVAGGADGLQRMSADDISLGWNAGVLVKFVNGVRVGLRYRSRIEHELKGDYATDSAGTVNALKVRSPLTFPDSATASISAPLGDRTRLMLSGRYYNWSLFRNITLIFPNGVRGTQEFRYRDSWSLSAGVDHALNDQLTLRAGSMFDKTPTNAQFLSTRIPDGDRIWASAGLSYRLNDRLTLNGSFAHVFIDRQSLVHSESFFPEPYQVTVTTRARNSGNVDMIATSLTAHF